ncbi:hypothetical protein LPJ59_003416 [Coemansia sp. RSA 2399]|nr:hypothetical protein LPJ59_003416 [Coemansia sp. RSA 2399]
MAKDYAQGSVDRDKRLAELLSCPPELQCDAVERLVRQTKLQTKSLKMLRRLMAPLVAKDLRDQLGNANRSSASRYVAYHCEDGDVSFASGIASELVRLMDGVSADWVGAISAGTKAEGGQLVIVGSSIETINVALSRIALVVGDYKGGFVRGLWQGKVSSFSKIAGVILG